MWRAGSPASSRDHDTLGGIGVEFAHERVAALSQGAPPHRPRRMTRHDFFNLKAGGVEFFGLVVVVDKGDGRGRIRLYMNLCWGELVILDGYGGHVVLSHCAS